jgi:hypothetical protein
MGMIADRIATKVRLARCDINKLPGVQSQYQINAYVPSSASRCAATDSCLATPPS